MNEAQIIKSYEIARERYAELGIDTDKALETLQKVQISLHRWQTDDVQGFESAGELTGGIQVNGNYPGKARNIDEVRADLIKVCSLLGGQHRINLHEIYGEFGGKKVDRNEVEPAHFQGWIDWAKENGLKLDFNSTSFSHPLSGSLTLSNPDKSVRDFWIEHTQRCRTIANEMGRQLDDNCIFNLWVHDGQKEMTVNRMLYRSILKDSLDTIYAVKHDHMKDCLESKVFGIGLEAFTVGSSDFYTAYCAQNNKIVTLDTGHFHPTEVVGDKVSSILLFCPEIMLHVSRPMRWDSDHVTLMDESTLELCMEITRCGALDRVHIGLDYFDGSINRIGAYVIGARATQKSVLRGLLEPVATLSELETTNRNFQKLALMEEAKAMPFGDVWNMFCLRNGVPAGHDFIKDIERYEAEITSKRQ